VTLSHHCPPPHTHTAPPPGFLSFLPAGKHNVLCRGWRSTLLRVPSEAVYEVCVCVWGGGGYHNFLLESPRENKMLSSAMKFTYATEPPPPPP